MLNRIESSGAVGAPLVEILRRIQSARSYPIFGHFYRVSRYFTEFRALLLNFAHLVLLYRTFRPAVSL